MREEARHSLLEVSTYKNLLRFSEMMTTPREIVVQTF